MPALRGTLTYARFYVEGEPPDGFREKFMRSIRHRAMRPLEVDEEDLERSGWAKLGEPFEIELSYDDVFFDSYVNLSFRTDRWAIPGPMMRRHVREAEAAYLGKKGRDPSSDRRSGDGPKGAHGKLSRREKSEIKLLVAKKLRKQVSPQTRAVDLSWSLEDGLVRFFGHAQKPAGLMSDLFEKTFGLELIPESPSTLADRLGLSKAQKSSWDELEGLELAE